MPILLVLMMGLVWLGFSVIGQADVTIEARHRSWKQRFDAGSAKPLHFLSDDFVTEEAIEDVDMGPLFDGVGGPESSHVVGMDTWDHNRIDLNQTPNWELYLTVAINAKTGGLQVVYGDARSMLETLQQDAARMVVDEMADVIRDALDNPLGDFNRSADDSKQEAENESDRKKRELEREIASVEDEIKQVEEHLRDLKEQKKDAVDGTAIESFESRIEVSENKLQRLKTSLSRLESDLKATG